LKNGFSFRPLDELEWKWNITRDVSIDLIYESELSTVPLGGKLQINLNPTIRKWLGNRRLWLNVRCYLKSNDQVLAKEQFELLGETEEDSSYEILNCSQNKNKTLKVEHSNESVDIWLTDIHNTYSKVKIASISNSNGQLISFSTPCGFSAIPNVGMMPNYTRAATDNDRGGIDQLGDMLPRWVATKLKISMSMQPLYKYSHWYRWKRSGLDPNSPPQVICRGIDVEEDHDSNVIIKSKNEVISSAGKKLFFQLVTYEINPDGMIHILNVIKPLKSAKILESIPRLGFSLSIDKSLHNILYMGRGPGENYCDRKSGSDMGIWRTSPSNMAYHYIVPSENGNVSDCSWASFTNKEGKGIIVVNDEKNDNQQNSEGFHFSALLHEQKELHNATHTYQLEDRKDGDSSIFVNLDHYQMGIGGDLSWMPCVLPIYHLKPRGEIRSR
jgi:hypothetical protein